MAFSGAYEEYTIQNPSAALTDFSIIRDLSLMSTAWWDEVDTSDGTKGRAAKGDGATELAVDWIDFDDVARTGVARIKWTGTFLSSGTQKIRLYPPKASNPSYAVNDTFGQYNAYNATWRCYYPNGGPTDRTANQNNGTVIGAVTPADTTGVLGKATTFPGSSANRIEIPDDTSLQVGSDFSISSVFVPAGTSAGGGTLFGKKDGNVEFALFQFFNRFRFRASTDVFMSYDATIISPGTTYHLFGGVEPGLLLRGYTDNDMDFQSGTVTGSGLTAAETMFIGRSYDGTIQHSYMRSVYLSDAERTYEHDQVTTNGTIWGTGTFEPGTPSQNVDPEDISSGIPTLDLMVVSQGQQVIPQSIFAGDPILGDFTPEQIFNLTLDDLIGGVPVVEQMFVSQSFVVEPDDIFSGSPILGNPSISQEYVVVFDDLIGEEPILGEPNILQPIDNVAPIVIYDFKQRWE